MTKKYEIIFRYIKDLSAEVPDAETFVFSRDYITKYALGININSKTLKNRMIEVTTNVNYKDPTGNKKKSHFEISYATVIKIIDETLNKNELEKILLCDIQKVIYPEVESILIKLIKDSGFPELKLDKKIDFDELFKKKTN